LSAVKGLVGLGEEAICDNGYPGFVLLVEFSASSIVNTELLFGVAHGEVLAYRSVLVGGTSLVAGERLQAVSVQVWTDQVLRAVAAGELDGRGDRIGWLWGYQLHGHPGDGKLLVLEGLVTELAGGIAIRDVQV